MITVTEAIEAIEGLREALNRGYVPPPMPPKPKVEKCDYCGRPIEKCGCGASK